MRHDMRMAMTAAAVFLLDQLSKAWAVATLTGQGTVELAAWLRGVEHPVPARMVVVSERFWRFRYVENPGAAFGLFADLPWGVRFGIFAGLAVLALLALRWLRRAGRRHPTLAFCVPLAAGGTLGNYFDRVRLGYVIDFIEWHKGDAFWWPVFNVADCALVMCAGALLGWYAWKLGRGEITFWGNDAAYDARARVCAVAMRRPDPAFSSASPRTPEGTAPH